MRTREMPHRVTEAAEHLIAELVANAATHGRLPSRDFRLVLRTRSETLLVEALADRWGVELGPVPHKTVWAELDRSHP